MVLNGTEYPVGNATSVSFSLDDGIFNVTVVAEDRYGRKASDLVVFGVDTTPPIVRIKEPKYGETVKSPVLLKFDVSDNFGVEYVTIIVDEVPVAKLGGNVTSILLTLGPEIHLVTVKAADVAGNSGYDSIRIKVVEEATGGVSGSEGHSFLWIAIPIVVFAAIAYIFERFSEERSADDIVVSLS